MIQSKKDVKALIIAIAILAALVAGGIFLGIKIINSDLPDWLKLWLFIK